MRLNIDKSYNFSGKNYRVKNLQTLIGQNLGYVFFKQIEKVKVALTSEKSSFLSFNEAGIEIEEPVTIYEFEEIIIKENLIKIEEYLQKFLDKHAITASNIDVVFLTGGTSLVVALQQIFEKRFGKEKIKSGDNFNSVAMGLAYSYSLLSQKNRLE